MLPKLEEAKFQCPHCNTMATQKWFNANNASSGIIGIIRHLYLNYRVNIADYSQQEILRFLDHINSDLNRNIYSLIPDKVSVANCSSCNEFTLWVNEDIVYPKSILLPLPNADLNDNIKELYLEASSILIDSPKGATALLRLALQELLKQVGKSGANINNDIKELVSEGLSPKIQQALDLLRVIGNNAVHPGQINFKDNSNVAHKLFGILNFIAEELISKPKELESLYSDLIPDDTKTHINQRDKK